MNPIVFVAEAPSQIEAVRGGLFTGSARQIWEQAFKQLKLQIDINDPDDIKFVSLLPTPVKAKISKGEALEAAPALKQKLKDLEPRAVVLCGAASMVAMGTGTGPQLHHGKKVWSEELQCILVNSYHPINAYYTPDVARDIKMDLRHLDTYRRGVNPTVLPELPWVYFDNVLYLKDMQNAFQEAVDAGDFLGVLDIETKGLNPRSSGIFSVGISFSETSNWIVTDQMMKVPEVHRWLKTILEDRDLSWAGQNLYQFDHKFLMQQYGIDWNGTIDTMLAHYTLDERQTGHGLKYLAQQYFNAPDWGKEIDWDQSHTFTQEFLETEVYPYQVYDLYFTRKLVDVLGEEIRNEGEKLLDLHYNVLIPGARGLGALEMNGIYINRDYLDELDVQIGEQYEQTYNKLQEEARRYGMDGINPNSPKQVKELILDKCGLTSKAGKGTDKEALESMDHPVAQMILDARVQSKLRGTYVRGLKDKIEANGRIHGDFLLWGTSTGRLCIAAGTEVEIVRDLTRREKVKIEDVQVGDLAYTYDDDCRLTIRPVVWAGKTGHKKVVRVHWRTNGARHGFTDMTPDHRVRMADGVYCEAQNLKVGTQVLALALVVYGQQVADITRIEELDQTVDVYDLEIEETHNFIAGEICVHNSSRNPNLQNIPSVMGPIIKRAFVPKNPDWKIINIDYSQLELRVAGILSGDDYLRKAYVEDKDLHTLVAASMYQIAPEDVTKMQRYHAKYVDFGVLYGRQAESLAKVELKCSVAEAQRFIDNFLADFDKLNDWIRSQHQFVEEHGYVETAFGRRRRFPVVTSSNIAEIRRQSVNSPIQGTASDFTLTSLGRMVQKLREGGLEDKIIPLITVHDSIVFEVHPDAIQTLVRLAHFEMTQNIPIDLNGVPVAIDCEIGPNYGDVKEFDWEALLAPEYQRVKA